MRNTRDVRRTQLRLTTACLSASLIWSSAAFAQEVPVEDPSASGLQEIIVTAQKREESLQKVPATITALGSETLETRQIEDVSDLQSEVPSLVVGEFYGTSLVTLRGISTGVTSGAEDPSVATHINGIYQPRSRSVDSAMADLERVEVLSGPQGTLYGRNATGGVVNYVLKRPADEFEGEVTARVGNYNRYGAQARVSGPLGDNARLLVSGIYDNRSKGYTRNLLPNAPRKRTEESRVYGGRAALDFEVGSRLTVELDAIYLDTKTVPNSAAFEPSGDPATAAFLGQQTFEPHRVYSDLASFTRSKYFQASNVMTLQLSDDVSFKSLTGWQTFKDHMLIDLDASPAASSPVDQRIKSDTFTQEFNLNAQSFDGALTSIFGVFYYKDDFLGQADTPFSIPGFAATFVTYSKIKSESYSFFTDQTLAITDRLRLQGGIRYNHDDKEAAQSLIVSGTPACPLLTNKRSWDSWTPRVGAQFDATDDVMLYGQWSKGFKSGGFTSNSCYDDFDPETIKGPEVGIKTKLFDNRVRFNLAGYYYKISNLQVQKAVDVGTFFVENAAAAKIYGAEFSLSALLADGLQLDAAGMVQSAKYTNFQNCDESVFNGACGAFDPRTPAQRNVDVSGNWLNRAAPYSLNLGLQYEFTVGNGGTLLLRGESFFSGKIRYSEFASAAATQPAYDTQNLFVTYTTADDRLTLRGYVKNIADTDYKISYFYASSTRQPTGNWAAPRTFGVDATVRF